MICGPQTNNSRPNHHTIPRLIHVTGRPVFRTSDTGEGQRNGLGPTSSCSFSMFSGTLPSQVPVCSPPPQPPKLKPLWPRPWVVLILDYHLVSKYTPTRKLYMLYIIYIHVYLPIRRRKFIDQLRPV